MSVILATDVRNSFYPTAFKIFQQLTTLAISEALSLHLNVSHCIVSHFYPHEETY